MNKIKENMNIVKQMALFPFAVFLGTLLIAFPYGVMFGELPNIMVVFLVVFCEIILIDVYSHINNKSWKEYFSSVTPRTVFWSFMGGIIIEVLLFLVLLGLSSFGLHNTNGNSQIGELISQGSYIVPVIFVSMIIPVLEEIIFRGFFFDLFDKPWKKVVIPSLLFGLMHVTSLSISAIFIAIWLFLTIGCVCAILRYKTNSIIPGIILHGTYNFVIMVVAIIITQ